MRAALWLLPWLAFLTLERAADAVQGAVPSPLKQRTVQHLGALPSPLLCPLWLLPWLVFLALERAADAVQGAVPFPLKQRTVQQSTVWYKITGGQVLPLETRGPGFVSGHSVFNRFAVSVLSKERGLSTSRSSPTWFPGPLSLSLSLSLTHSTPLVRCTQGRRRACWAATRGRRRAGAASCTTR
jgi:hypothetical protein